MVCFSSFLILCKSVFEPMYLAGSEGSVTISVLKVDFESNTIAPALKVLFRSIIIDSVAMCMFDILNFGVTNEKGLLLKQK